MPCAGATIPPVITPLRKLVPGRPITHIDSATYIELETETPGAKIYFTTDGSKPNPFQLKVAGRESTFKYKGPFSLKSGKRSLKAVALSRDGQESNVVTKTFTVDDVGPPNESDDLDGLFDSGDDIETYDIPTRPNPLRSSAPAGLFRKKEKRATKKSKEAWATTSSSFSNGVVNGVPVNDYIRIYGYDGHRYYVPRRWYRSYSWSEYGVPVHPDSHQNKVQIPDGPFNPTNYSGTQMNFWGVAPAGGSIPHLMSGAPSNMPPTYPIDRPGQLGYLTDKMIRNMEQPKLTVADVRRLMEGQQKAIEPPPPPTPPTPEPLPAIELPVKRDPEVKKESPGEGDWRGQLEHVYAHLIQHAKNNIPFRTAISEPKMASVLHADFDEEDDAYLLTISVAKSGVTRPRQPPPATKKLRNVVKAVSKPKKQEPVIEKAKSRNVEKAKPPAPKKKVVKPKEEKKQESYFETEEYESEDSYHPPPPRRRRTRHPRRQREIEPDSDDESRSQRGRKKLDEKHRNRYEESEDSERDPDLVIKRRKQHKSKKDSKTKPSVTKKVWDTDPYFLTEEYKQEGTVKAWEYFNAEVDCEGLRAAMKGMGTNEDAIVNILPYRNCTQRVEITIMFKTMFGKDLRKELDSETSGDFGTICKALCMPAAEYDASEIHKAIKGLGTDDDALIEILCTRTNTQIKAMKDAYKTLYSMEMDKDVKGDTSGNFRKLLVAQMSGNRSEDPTFDRTAAQKDAKALFDAGEKKWGTDESVFNMILCQRSFPYLRAVFEEYEKLSKNDIEEVIKSEFSGDIKNGFVTVVRCIKDKPGYFAKKLQKSMKGLGTKDHALIRVIVSRCEADMVQIMASFQQQFNGSLADWIRDDTSGDYQAMLLALIGDRPAPSPTAEEVEAAEEPAELEEVEEENVQMDGTVKPADPFDAQKDCEKLKKAMKGFGTDEVAIIAVWSLRTNEQRQEIKKMYKTKYGKDLMKELSGETSGNFKQSLEAMGQLPADYDANELRKAMKGLGTDEDALIEVLCTRDNDQMNALKEAYTRLHRRKLEEDLISETSGHLKRLLVSMVQASRPAGNMIDRRKARKDAKDLLEAGEDKWGTDESRFNVIMCSRSYPQLRATFEEYDKLSEKDIEEVIKSEMSGDIKKGMLTLVRCIRNKTQQFAKRLHEAMKGLGTDDDSLIRVCVSRSEIDMVQIKQHFESMFDQPLGKFIADDISGDYRKTILTLIGEEQFLSKK